MKKNVLSKVLSCVLAVAMVATFAGCDKDNASTSTSTPASTASTSTVASTDDTSVDPEPQGPDMTPLTITVTAPSSDTHEEANAEYDRLVADLNDYLQMDLKWKWVVDTEYYGQIDTDIVEGNFCDVMVVGKNATFLDACANGYFWDLTDYIDDYDNLCTIPQATRENISANGHIYALPRSRTLARNGFGYRVDWCEKLNLPTPPTTWEEFSDMLYEFTYSDPDGNGVDDTVGLFLDSWTGVWDIMQVWFNVPNGWGIDANGDLVPAQCTDEYKTALAAFRELYDQGCINADFMDVAPGKARDQGLRAQLGGCGVQVLDDQRKVETYFEGDDVALSTADEPIYMLGGYIDCGYGPKCLPTTGYNNMIAISTQGNVKTEADLKRVLQFLNDINDGECMNLIEYGWEGTTYKLDDDGYIELLTGDDLTAAGVASTHWNFGFNQVIPYFTADENARPNTVAPATGAVQILEQQLYADDIQYCVPNYGASYEGSSATFVALNGELSTILSDAKTAYIKGEIEDAGLDAAIDQWLAAGGQKIIDEVNELYHAANK